MFRLEGPAWDVSIHCSDLGCVVWHLKIDCSDLSAYLGIWTCIVQSLRCNIQCFDLSAYLRMWTCIALSLRCVVCNLNMQCFDLSACPRMLTYIVLPGCIWLGFGTYNVSTWVPVFGCAHAWFWLEVCCFDLSALPHMWTYMQNRQWSWIWRAYI